jgi:hypothetical protein
MTEDIKQMMTELTAPFNNDNSLPTPRPPKPSMTAVPKPSTTTVAPNLLLKTEVVQAHSEYTGPDWKHLLIMPGDVINVYAYLNEATVVGFNTRTFLGGRFPIDITKKIEPQSDVKAEIFICTSRSYEAGNPESLRYEIGQYVRVCHWETDFGRAYGFNQSTLAMGKVDTRYCFKKVEWHKEN